MNQLKIGEFLKELRREKNLTQQEAADSLFVSQKTISRWETGEGIPDISIILEVAKFYDVTVDEILKGCRNEKEEIKIVYQTVENKESKSKLKIYFFISIGIMLFFLILGIIFRFTVTSVILYYICPISWAIGLGLYLFGYNEYKSSEDIKTLKRYSCLLSDILFSCVVIVFFIFTSFGGLIPLYEPMPVLTYLILAYIIIAYIVLRLYFIKNNRDLNNMIKSIAFLNMIASYICIFTIFSIYFEIESGSFKQILYNNTIVHLFTTDYIENYEFRIVALLLFVIALGGIIFVYKKEKYQLSIIFLIIGIIASATIYIDLLNFNWSKIHEKSLMLNGLGFFFFLFYLVGYIINVVLMKKRKNIIL